MKRPVRTRALWPALLGVFAIAPQAWADSKPVTAAAPAAKTSLRATADPSSQELFRGKIVFLREALARHKIESREEFDKQVVLETPAGELIPIVSDWRGRAFFQDDRLRNRDVELIGKRQKGIPYLQVLMVFTFDGKGNRQYTDYYCDTCGFPAYEIKQCECCQGPLRLRFQPRDLPDYIKAKYSNTLKAAGTATRPTK